MSKEGIVNTGLRVARVARNLSPIAVIPGGWYGSEKGFTALNDRLGTTSETAMLGINVGGLEIAAIMFGPFVVASLLQTVYTICDTPNKR